jgi:very-short-patch-repair endonuclease
MTIEIDGPSQDVLEQQLADEARDAWLRDQGFRVVRLSNELVIASTGLAVARIRNAMTN